MKVDSEKSKGDVRVEGRRTVHGMITGSVFVDIGGTLVLHGMVCKNVVISNGAEAIIHGMVVGDVENLGGVVEVFGMINGSVIERGGRTRVAPNAIVHGGIVRGEVRSKHNVDVDGTR